MGMGAVQYRPMMPSQGDFGAMHSLGGSGPLTGTLIGGYSTTHGPLQPMGTSGMLGCMPHLQSAGAMGTQARMGSPQFSRSPSPTALTGLPSPQLSGTRHPQAWRALQSQPVFQGSPQATQQTQWGGMQLGPLPQQSRPRGVYEAREDASDAGACPTDFFRLIMCEVLAKVRRPPMLV